MPDANDMDLLQEFARHNSEAAFAALVQRHLNLVYSVALRYTANPGDAQDVVQAVFIILARKAARLNERTVLTGWLYETTRLTAAGWLRTQKRRQAREQEAYMQSTLDQAGTDNLWRQLAPHLEAAMSRLNARERTLLALRFYENKTGAEAAALLGIREEAAHKRTARALEKLRKIFTKHGVSSTTAMLAGAISANSLQVAPVGLAKAVTVLAVAKGVAAGGSTLILVKGALKLMAWTQMKTAVVVGVSVLMIVGMTSVLPRHREESDNTYNAPGVESFRKHLSGDAQIKLLRFSEIDGRTGVRRHYLAAVDGNDFFLREYEPAENPYALITTNSWIQSNGHSQGKFFGRFRDECWNINGHYITKSSVSDSVVNVCQLEINAARHKIDFVLNLGASPYDVKHGSFVWNPTNNSRFTVGLAANVSVKEIKLGHEIEVTNLWGRIVAKNGLVGKLYWTGGQIDYEYETNSSVPIGLPTKITVGKRWFGYERVFLIEDLVYGSTEDPQTAFSPESKYDSPDLPQINYFTNGQRKIIQQGFKLSPPGSRK